MQGSGCLSVISAGGIPSEIQWRDAPLYRCQCLTAEPIDFFRPLKPFLCHGFHLVRMLAREIVQFGAIGFQIVQLAGYLLGTAERPGALAQGTIGSKVEIYVIVLRPHLVVE